MKARLSRYARFLWTRYNPPPWLLFAILAFSHAGLFVFFAINGRGWDAAYSLILCAFSAKAVPLVYYMQDRAAKYLYLRDEANPGLWARLTAINEGTHEDPTIDAMSSSAEAWDHEVETAMRDEEPVFNYGFGGRHD
jgi:hypothetical protein